MWEGATPVSVQIRQGKTRPGAGNGQGQGAPATSRWARRRAAQPSWTESWNRRRAASANPKAGRAGARAQAQMHTHTHTHARVRTHAHTHARQNARRTARCHRNEAAGGTRLAEEVPPPAPDPVLLVDGARVVAAGGDLRGSTVVSLRRRSRTACAGRTMGYIHWHRPGMETSGGNFRKTAESVPRVPQPSG